MGSFINYGIKKQDTLWWREIAPVHDGGGGWYGGQWFRDIVSKVVGNARGTSFWTDMWLDGVVLLVRFRRLYDLSVHKHYTVAEMSELGWEDGGDA